MDAVYEVVDSSSDEIYYSLGMFSTLEEAKKEIIKCADKDYPISEYHGDDQEEITIRERPLQWGEDYKIVFTMKREQSFSDKSDGEWITL